MNNLSHPDASRLVYRIRTALTGESVGQETAKLAWQYAESIERANRALVEAERLIEADRLLEALEEEEAFPHLLQAAAALDFAAADAWSARCALYSWRCPAVVDTSRAEALRPRFATTKELKDWLYTEYRGAERAKDSERAYRTIRQLVKRFPEEATAQEELARQESRQIEAAEVAIRASLEELIPLEKTHGLVERYQKLRVPLHRSESKLVAEALAVEQAIAVQEANQLAESAVEAAKGASPDSDWISAENQYLACDYKLAITNNRGAIEPELKAALDETGVALSRLRNNFEAIISLSNAISALKSSASSSGSRKRLAERLDKLRSLEKQAIRISGQIPPDLQKELKDAYAFARRKRLPLAATFSISVAAVLAATIWMADRHARQTAFEEETASALVALQQAEKSRQTATVESALQAWDDAIEHRPAESALQDQAQVLEQWLEIQNRLEREYVQQAEQLEQLARKLDPAQNEQAILRLASDAERTRRDLAPDRGVETEKRIQNTLQQWNASLTAARQEREQLLQSLQQELAVAFENAANASSLAEFEQRAQETSDGIAAIGTVARSKSGSPAERRLIEAAHDAQERLARLEDKWTALAREKRSLAEANSLEEYLERLTRIHSFDILPANTKTAVEQSLRLESAFGALERRVLLPDEAGAWTVFSGAGNYTSDQPELSVEEAAYLERIDRRDIFENVYRSTVQYFEDNANPQSEYEMYLVEPIAKSESTTAENSINIAFKVRGYNEMGYPETTARDIPFISRNDGSFWGFFYKPSKLSTESEYYQNTLSLGIRQLKAGSPRLTVIKLLGDLEEQDHLAPAFRAYWQQRLLEFMSLNPWKWGLALSPSLQEKAQALAELSGGEISERLWLSIIEQTVPSPELNPVLERAVADQALEEVEGFATLYQNALSGDFALAGRVTERGELALRQELAPDEPLWTVNTLTGRIEKLDDDVELAPLAPVLRYRYQSGGREALLQRARALTGIDFSDEKYSELMPPLFQ